MTHFNNFSINWRLGSYVLRNFTMFHSHLELLKFLSDLSIELNDFTLSLVQSLLSRRLVRNFFCRDVL